MNPIESAGLDGPDPKGPDVTSIKCVTFAAPSSQIKPALYRRPALAKDAGVPADGTGSHRIAIGTDAEPFTDPDGFVSEATRV
jgi:hypothetical protein